MGKLRRDVHLHVRGTGHKWAVLATAVAGVSQSQWVGQAQADALHMLGSCKAFPTASVFNTPVNDLPLHDYSATLVDVITSAGSHVKADWGSTWIDPYLHNAKEKIGIPINVVPSKQPLVSVTLAPGWGTAESDGVVRGTHTAKYPFPSNALIEDPPGGDAHVLVVREGECVLYEVWEGKYSSTTGWKANNGAIFNLSSTAMRPEYWTSADAAGLPIAPLLLQYDEVYSTDEEIGHAMRFTAPSGYILGATWPATHRTEYETANGCATVTTKYAGATYDHCPAMGQRFRLSADFNETLMCFSAGGNLCETRDYSSCDCTQTFPSDLQKILRAMKKYGLILADGGDAWYVTGAYDTRWDNSQLHMLNYVWAGWFEAVNVSSIIVSPTSYATTYTGVDTPPSATPRPSTKTPTRHPTKVPTKHPTKHPTKLPTKHPTKLPTKHPTKHPTSLKGTG